LRDRKKIFNVNDETTKHICITSTMMKQLFWFVVITFCKIITLMKRIFIKGWLRSYFLTAKNCKSYIVWDGLKVRNNKAKNVFGYNARVTIRYRQTRQSALSLQGMKVINETKRRKKGPTAHKDYGPQSLRPTNW